MSATSAAGVDLFGSMLTVPKSRSTTVDYSHAIVLGVIAKHGPEGVGGYTVLEYLTLETGTSISPPSVYGSLRILQDSGLIAHIGTREESGNVPLRLYAITDEGRAALRGAITFHKAVLSILETAT